MKNVDGGNDDNNELETDGDDKGDGDEDDNGVTY